MKRVTAFSPGHVTGLFYMRDLEDDPLYCGSLGAGFSIVKGAQTTVSLSGLSHGRSDISINDLKGLDTPVSLKIMELFFSKTGIAGQGLKVAHKIETPQGAGFGSSGAGALSLVFALNRLYGDPLSALQASQIAHSAEVLCKTGLGTVMGETLGGVKILVKPGAPGIGATVSIPYPEGLYAMFVVYGPLSTREALSDPELRKKVTESGKKYHSLIKKSPDFENFLKYSREFAESTGIIPKSVRMIMDQLDKHKINCSMLMFGEGTFSIFPKSDVPVIRKIAEGIIEDLKIENLECEKGKAEECDPQGKTGADVEFGASIGIGGSAPGGKINRKPYLFFSNIAKGGVSIVSED
ncbi:MAG: GHMP kinase [Spirochaetia bacterium]|jgi:pantoate kinase|nr:GHMP kinase [Spirochaetia bacterium]